MGLNSKKCVAVPVFDCDYEIIYKTSVHIFLSSEDRLQLISNEVSLLVISLCNVNAE